MPSNPQALNPSNHQALKQKADIHQAHNPTSPQTLKPKCPQTIKPLSPKTPKPLHWLHQSEIPNALPACNCTIFFNFQITLMGICIYKVNTPTEENPPQLKVVPAAATDQIPACTKMIPKSIFRIQYGKPNLVCNAITKSHFESKQQYAAKYAYYQQIQIAE